MHKPQALNAFLFPSAENHALGSVETPFLMRILRPATMALWLIVFAVEAQTLVATGRSTHGIVVALATLLFVAVHIQFWYEESEQGRRFHNALERMRGRMYEDEATGLPNNRHFVFELRRQMMRSVRNGHGFALVLTDIAGMEPTAAERLLPGMARALRHALGEGDFIARLQGPIFAAIVADERDRTSTDKSDAALVALGSCVPLDVAGVAYPVVSITGYEGEVEVRDFLRRAQRDLIATRANDRTVALRGKGQRPARAA